MPSTVIPFEDAPEAVKAIFRSVQKSTTVRHRTKYHDDPEAYTVSHNGETTVFKKRNGVWTAVRTY